MSVKKEDSGRRSIEVAVEVPGTPEQVWEAIATGPGISSWFVPTEVVPGQSGSITCHFGGMDSKATVTEWDPPRRFAATSAGSTPGGPPLATEWTVEARSGGTCIVRVVHSLFASTDDWDDELTGTESGWPRFFRVLSLYLAYFRGQQYATFHAMGMAATPEPQAWQTLTGMLGLADATPGERRSSGGNAPALAGIVERPAEGKALQALMRIDEPGSGLLGVGAFPMGGGVYLTVNFYLFGEGAADAVAREAPLWQAWMQHNFPIGAMPMECTPDERLTKEL